MSPFAAKVHCFLLYKRLDFECFYINPLRVKQDLPLGRLFVDLPAHWHGHGYLEEIEFPWLRWLQLR
jgi:hypothetical protein